jgi:hypothetical protein
MGQSARCKRTINRGKKRKIAMTNEELHETNQLFLQTLRKSQMPFNELGQPLESQAVEIIESGWKGVGYLMVAHRTYDDGHLWGCKRVAHDVSSAKELDHWFSVRIAERYTPLFRYYVSDAPTAAANKEYMKGAIIHEEHSLGYTVLVESMFAPNVPAAISAYASAELSAPSVASEFALMVDIGKRGVKVVHFSR